MKVAQVVFRSAFTDSKHSIYNATISRVNDIEFVKINGTYFKKKQILPNSLWGDRKLTHTSYIQSIDLKEYIGSKYYVKTKQVQYTGIQKLIRSILSKFNPAIKMEYTVHYFTQYVWSPVEVSTIITEGMIVGIDADNQIIDLNDVYREVYTFETDDTGKVIGSMPINDDCYDDTFEST